MSCFSFTRHLYSVDFRNKLPDTNHKKVQFFKFVKIKMLFLLTKYFTVSTCDVIHHDYMFDTVHVSAISNISVLGNVFVSVIMCLKYSDSYSVLRRRK